MMISFYEEKLKCSQLDQEGILPQILILGFVQILGNGLCQQLFNTCRMRFNFSIRVLESNKWRVNF